MWQEDQSYPLLNLRLPQQPNLPSGRSRYMYSTYGPMRRFGTVAWKNDITVTSEIDMLRPAMTNSPSARPRLVLILSISIATAKRRGERRRERPIFLPFTILPAAK